MLGALVCLAFPAFSQCDADAGANVTICAGQSVQLGGTPTAINAGPGVTYDWDASTGTDPADIANPTVSPNVTTTYEIDLDNGGCNGQSDQITVTVLPAPSASFTYSPNNSPCATTPIQFTSTVTGCTGCQYDWDFGDGSGSSAANPSHTFNAIGAGTQNFTVTLTVTSANGCDDVFTSSITIKRIPDVELTDPITSFTQCTGDLTFTPMVFDAGTTTGNSTYTISWGDGSPNWTGSSSPQGLSHTYTGTDVFDLVYTVTGSNGCTASETYYVSNITNPSIGAANPGGTQGCGPLNICFPLNNYVGNHSSTTYLVDFGDGSPTVLLNHPPPTEICHSYSGSSCATNPSGYTFSITATNNCDQSVATIFPVKVYSAPAAAFTPSPVPACVNSTVTFTNNSTPGYNNNCAQTGTYTWNFGDGSPNVTVTSLATQTHVYTAPGIYTVTMTATNFCGNSTVTQQVCIEQAPTPTFTVNSNLGCVSMAVTTDNTTLSNYYSCNTSTAWVVNYSDLPCDPDNGNYTYTGSTNSSSLEPTFSLQSVGVYTITLQMQNACGLFQDSEIITVNTTPIVDVVTPTSVCANTTGQSSAIVDPCNLAITNYAWTFTGGSPATFTGANPPAITYASTGNFAVTLVATNACGTGTDTSPISVLAIPDVQISSSVADLGICYNQGVTLTATGAGSYSWSPSTYLSSTFGNSVTAYPTGPITYTVTGTSGSCTDTGTISLTIDPLPIVQPAGVYAMCFGETEQLGLTITSGTAPYISYNWTPAATLNNANIVNPISNATSSTTYSVQVTDSEGCIGTGNVPVTVNPLPLTNAGPDITLCNQPIPTPLTGYSPTSGGTGSWSGANVTSSGVFTPGGVQTYALTYCFTNSATGCLACDNMNVIVQAPVSANGGPDTTTCVGNAAIQLPSGSWTGSSNVSTSGLYTPPGAAISETLTVSQGVGSCATTDQVIVTVLASPVANAINDMTICAGDTLQLGVTCATCPNGPLETYIWSGGPVSNGLIANPFVNGLNSTTTYTVTVVDDEGCTDNDQVNINVNPLPNTNAGVDITLCNQPIPTQLSGLPAGGTWTGNGVTSFGAFTPSAVGSFTLTYCYTNPITGCVKCDELTVTVINATIANAGADVEICHNQPSFTLNAPTPGGTWTAVTPGTPFSGANTFNPNTVGQFVMAYNLGSGTCLTSDTMIVEVHDLPQVNAGNNTTICLNECTDLNSTTIGGQLPYNFSWNFAATLSSANTADPTACPLVTTNYTLTVTDFEGCVGSDQVTVIVTGLPIVEAGPAITICDQPIAEVLSGFSPMTGAGGVGTWTGPGIIDSTGIYQSPGIGTYTIYYNYQAGSSGCGNMDSTTVTVIAPIVANAGPDLSFCFNEGTHTIVGYSPAINATWLGDGIIDPSNGILQTELAGVGTHTLYITTGTGTCFSIDSLELEVIGLPVVSAGPGNVVCGNAAIFDLVDFIPATGGNWEGTGIIDATLGTFDPSTGAANYTLSYSYFDPLTLCGDTSTTTVNVSPIPVANFGVAPLGCTNANVDVSNTSAGATSYSWNYGNNDTATGFDPNYTYPDEGWFTIQLIVENNFGCADTAENSNEIIHPPVSTLELSTYEGCAPLEVAFDNLSVGNYLTFDWDLANTTSIDSIPGNEIYQQGPDVLIYPISLTATNFCGSSTDQAEVTVLPQPVAGFGTDLNVNCSPFVVHFNNTSVGLPDTFLWDFSDGSTSSVEEPDFHVFFTDTVATDYLITLYLSNECGLDTAYQTITVLPNTVTSFFNTSVTEGCEPLEVTFTDYSDGGNQISYDLGNSTFTANDNPTQVYPVGEYTIYQFVDNGCSYDTSEVTITVFDSPEIDFTTNVPNICTNNLVTFVPEIGSSVEIMWDFGDGTTSEVSSPTHEYTAGSNYVVTMTGVNDNLCSTTISHPFVVYQGPFAEFTVPDQLGCSPYEVCFSNTTNAGFFYTWDYGDGNTSSDEDECHTYINNGATAELMTVRLIAEDIQLCADTFELSVIVAPQPTAAFLLSSFESCYFPQSIDALNASVYASGYEWYLNNDYYSDNTNVNFNFNEVGSYDVELLVNNAYGCEASANSTYTIHPLPVLGLDANPIEGCVSLDVMFENISNGADTYIWDLGDGTTTTAAAPNHTYTEPGIYDISLYATTDQGCTDTLVIEEYINVFNLPIANFQATPDETNIWDPTFTFIDNSYDAHFWVWEFGDGDLRAGVPITQHTYPQAGLWPVTLTVTNEHGCESTKQDVVVVEDIFQVFVPNTFTPDGDGINEVFLPQLSGVPFIEHYKFEIFNRWGVVIFQTDDPHMAWTGDVRDGEYFGKDEAYNWRIVVQLKNSDSERVFQGHVNLIR
jgi:large repetitive protein